MCPWEASCCVKAATKAYSKVILFALPFESRSIFEKEPSHWKERKKHQNGKSEKHTNSKEYFQNAAQLHISVKLPLYMYFAMLHMSQSLCEHFNMCASVYDMYALSIGATRVSAKGLVCVQVNSVDKICEWH